MVTPLTCLESNQSTKVTKDQSVNETELNYISMGEILRICAKQGLTIRDYKMTTKYATGT